MSEFALTDGTIIKKDHTCPQCHEPLTISFSWDFIECVKCKYKKTIDRSVSVQYKCPQCNRALEYISPFGKWSPYECGHYICAVHGRYNTWEVETFERIIVKDE
jgi:ssDNA-binding Zn-finger/Zn-ribbon topoisomerase 1